MKRAITVLLFVIITCCYRLAAQVPQSTILRLNDYFSHYDDGNARSCQATTISVAPDHKLRVVNITVSDEFGFNDFTLKDTKKIYKKVRKTLPKPLRRYRMRVITCGTEITLLCPESAIGSGSLSEGWGNINYNGEPWTKNVSRPFVPTMGLEGRHVSLWASHGRYYDSDKGRWKWQRPELFGTVEDLFTQSFVVPYLIPMLQNAGANVFTPRERDWQKNEVIVDNDMRTAAYSEHNGDSSPWVKAPNKGFALHKGNYTDGENPFQAGTARMNLCTTKASKASTAAYQPLIPEAGRYAVYVSYQTIDGSIDDAEYTVYHKGQSTTYHVNQQMGGGTWVYLGTFEFEAGSSPRNRVVISNVSTHDGLVTTDAVRFGGGMGNIQRGGTTSGLPRSDEGARYYAQWAGAPYSVYSFSDGSNDYKDDINTRSLMTNWLAGGSPYVPTTAGKNVPIELSLAVHSDAGYNASDAEAVGTLAICTTDFNDGRLASGCSRGMSHDLSEAILTGIERDICQKYPPWTLRGIWDKNYSETRLPGVPSTIVETMSHQNPADLFLGHDPNFKFQFSRSLYKSILKYISAQHGRPCVVQPLPPTCFRAVGMSHGKIQLAWNTNPDPDEPTAAATSYIIYTAVGADDFDNGIEVKDTTIMLDLQQGEMYRFRVAAANRGGVSFCSPTLAASYAGDDAATVLVVDGFSRLSPPAIIDTNSRRGFDLDRDMGVSCGLAAEWIGRQQNFNAAQGGREGSSALGYTDSSLFGQFVMGNTMDNAAVHAEAIHEACNLNIVSCTLEAIERGCVVPSRQTTIIDMAFGLQKSDAMAVRQYKTFNTVTRRIIEQFRQRGGSVLVSGAYVMSDMLSEREQDFMTTNLSCNSAGVYNTSRGNTVTGMGTSFAITSRPNANHYACQHADVLRPSGNAFVAMTYADGQAAAVAEDTDKGRTFTMGFPLESIADKSSFKAITKGIISFLLK